MLFDSGRCRKIGILGVETRPSLMNLHDNKALVEEQVIETAFIVQIVLKTEARPRSNWKFQMLAMYDIIE